MDKLGLILLLAATSATACEHLFVTPQYTGCFDTCGTPEPYDPGYAVGQFGAQMVACSESSLTDGLIPFPNVHYLSATMVVTPTHDFWFAGCQNQYCAFADTVYFNGFD